MRENRYNFPTCEKNRITLLISKTIFLTNGKNTMTNGIALGLNTAASFYMATE